MVSLGASEGNATFNIDVTVDATWLSVTPLTGSMPHQNVEVMADKMGLEPGIFVMTIFALATAPGCQDTTVSVTLAMKGSYCLVVSTRTDHSNSVLLELQIKW